MATGYAVGGLNYGADSNAVVPASAILAAMGTSTSVAPAQPLGGGTEASSDAALPADRRAAIHRPIPSFRALFNR